jgi:hypothetical protein
MCASALPSCTLTLITVAMQSRDGSCYNIQILFATNGTFVMLMELAMKVVAVFVNKRDCN